MNEKKSYSARSVSDGLTKTFHQYLEAQYHIWDESLIAERRALLESPGTTVQEPQLEATAFYATGKPYKELNIPTAAKRILQVASNRPNIGIFPEPYLHQALALEAFLGRGEELIVATGTGSGKTESFLMPILGALATEQSERPACWGLAGVRALLLYPMNALVNDQLGRLRRIFGDSEIMRFFSEARNGTATFGMYTSRTPYPGQASQSKNRDRIGKIIEKLYLGRAKEAEQLLKREGKWPAKDIKAYFENEFNTGLNDAELFSRMEIQKRAPDLLVTNYSMLEYMLLRPIEKAIFEQTEKWLAEDKRNRFIVVLDEAHMYRGAGGAEVAYLLRRLHSRLGVTRDRIQYVLTSASLGTGEEAEKRIKTFAASLTGLAKGQRGFTLVTGTIAKKASPNVATVNQALALAKFDFGVLHRAYQHPKDAIQAFEELARKCGTEWGKPILDESSLKNAIYDWLNTFGPAALAANKITAKPHSIQEIVLDVFPNVERPQQALESLLALMSYGRERGTDRVFSPIRSHLFFRGLGGLYVCTNSKCNQRHPSSTGGRLGALFSAPRLHCGCGARVYELLTHRDCGVAFIRAFLSDENGLFLWHEKSKGLWTDLSLIEAHFLVEADRRASGAEGMVTWLHIFTGQLVTTAPSESARAEYLELVRPDGAISEKGHAILTFNKRCPVCVRRWQGTSKIMDLATKGEAPFAHLIREQVAHQPKTREPSERAPNGGRKSLLFSDGRQKAARLARDIPREIEKDVFRQLLFMASDSLVKVGYEPRINNWMYVAILDVLARTGIQILDGEDRQHLLRDVRQYKRWYSGNLLEALLEFTPNPPPGYKAVLFQQMGARFYSVYALTLGYLRPANRAIRAMSEELAGMPKEILHSLAAIWMQEYAEKFAFDPSSEVGVRIKAAGYPVDEGLAPRNGFDSTQQDFLRTRDIDVERLVNCFADTMCESSPRGGIFLAPDRTALESAVNKTWYQCNRCTAVSPVVWWGHCPNCLADNPQAVQPGATSYLRARKSFWRDPVVNAVEGREVPLNLIVEEHTAQLSYRDIDEPTSTTEEFERRFKDILVSDDDTSIDVLSSTTTMEVGIDIGSLVAVGLRNVPPQRQNYQQRAGRAGRRGSSISTVVTYAQNSPHDNFYFENPQKIISGEPTLPHVDTDNAKIIERHIRAQMVQAFFHTRSTGSGSANIFTMLGETWPFYSGEGAFSFQSLRIWLESTESEACFDSIVAWLPASFRKSPLSVAREFVADLEEKRPSSPEQLEQSEEYLIEFLFSHGFLPAYAFPRDLCALQIEKIGPDRRVQIVQRPQQGLSIALSEYAPGRSVVVNKQTYRIGSVAAGGTSVVENRAERLFSGRRQYVHCPTCTFTVGFIQSANAITSCPTCSTSLVAVTVIQPEVAYPENGKEVDEYDDEQVFSQSTGAQLPLPQGESPPEFIKFLAKGKLAFARNQSLVMVNKGASDSHGDGFLICNRCGKASLDRKAISPHTRDYKIDARKNVPPPQHRCNGDFERVYLGYSFSSDILLFRIPIERPLRFDARSKRDRQPLSDALQSVCDALVIAISRELDIDIREINSGYRYLRIGDDNFADIFMYDTLSGGAGYATQAGAVFERIFSRVEDLLTTCSCATSCDKCLRHYGNRLHHESLDRFLAEDIVRFVRDGRLPAVADLPTQERQLAPISRLLTLAGWKISSGKGVAAIAALGARQVRMSSFPALLNPLEVGFVSGLDAFSFSPYELSRDLPGAYAEIA